MGKHDVRSEQTQVNDIRSNEVEKILTDNVLTQSASFEYLDFDLIPLWRVRQEIETATARKIAVTVTADFSINWQTDIVPGGTDTYADVIGNLFGTFAYFTDGANLTKYDPAISYTLDGSGNILVVSFTGTFPGTIIII